MDNMTAWACRIGGLIVIGVGVWSLFDSIEHGNMLTLFDDMPANLLPLAFFVWWDSRALRRKPRTDGWYRKLQWSSLVMCFPIFLTSGAVTDNLVIAWGMGYFFLSFPPPPPKRKLNPAIERVWG